MNGMLELTTHETTDDGLVALSTSTGQRFRLPKSATPASCPSGGCFMLDMDEVAEADMADADRHEMARAILNEMLTAGTA